MVSPSIPNLSADDVDLSFRLDETLNAINTKGDVIYAIYDAQDFRFAYTKYPFRYMEEFRRYERDAREAGRGLWTRE